VAGFQNLLILIDAVILKKYNRISFIVPKCNVFIVSTVKEAS
jgi:hypothetical protein